MFKNHRKLKLIFLGAAVLLPTAFGLLCTKLHIMPVNSADAEVFGVSLLPNQLSASSGLQLFQFALLCAMIVISAILAGIVLSKRMINKQ